MVGIHIDANYIFCEKMKNRTEGEMINAYQKMVDRMQLAGLGLKHHRLDNKCSDNFKKCIRKNNMTHKLVPPDMINAYQKMVDRMQLGGLGLKHHRLDNECSDNF
jgi:hypothetical protein